MGDADSDYFSTQLLEKNHSFLITINIITVKYVPHRQWLSGLRHIWPAGCWSPATPDGFERRNL